MTGYDMIFNLSSFTSESPSQLALGYEPSANTNFILFHTDSWVFLIGEDGSFYPGFPFRIHDFNPLANSHPVILEIDDGIVFLITDYYQGIVAVDIRGRLNHTFTQFWNKGDINPQFFMNDDFFHMIYSDRDESIFSVALKINPENDRIQWNGFRNQSTGVLIRERLIHTPPEPVNITVFVYPNPIRQNAGHVRITGSNSPARIQIFNISGQLVAQEQLDTSPEAFRDFRFDASRFSSGVYFVIVEIDGRVFRDRFAVIR
jgi:hypothetical protein